MSTIQLRLFQRLRDRRSKNSTDRESDSVKFVFNCLASFVLISIGTMLTICLLAAVDERFSTPSSEEPQAVLQSSNMANR